jgi:hypothetical protein
VWEEAHGNRPEIHPSELYWWKANPDLTFLLILQEDSNRFDRRSDYEVSDPVPSWWRPWSASPRTGEFKLAIEFFKGESATTYSITDDTTQGIWKRHVITASDPLLVEDADDGKEHAIALDGQIALRLNEVQQSDDEIGIRFVNMCRDPQNPSRFQGFVSIRTRVGINDRGGEGYHFLQVERHVRDMRAVAEERPFVPAVNVFGETVKQSLRRLDSNELAFDININIAAEPGIKRERRIPKRVEIISKRTQRELVVIPGISGMAQVKNVPVNFGKQETKMNIIMQSGDVTTLYIPPIDLSPRITELAGDVVATPSVWQNFKNLSRSENIGELQNAEAVMVKEWLVESYPNYAVLRGGKISLEDDSPIAEKLNEIVYRNEIDRISELWGTAKPFAVKWKFEALNTANQQAVPVVINKKDDNAVSIYLNHGMMEDSRIRIHFPEKLKKDIIKLVATAQMTDALHNISSTQHTVWSHVITAESESVLVENLLMALAPETRMTVRDLLAISQLDIADNFQTRQPRLRRARMLRLMLMRFSADLRVTNEELRKLIVLARRVK